MADRRMKKPQAPRNNKNSGRAPRAEPPHAAPALTQLAAFDAAIKLFHARQLAEARVLFQQAADGAERDIAQRAQLHIVMCDRRLQPAAVSFGTAEEYYTYGVALLNARNVAEARTNLEKALAIAPGSEHIHYALALAQALAGGPASAPGNTP